MDCLVSKSIVSAAVVGVMSVIVGADTVDTVAVVTMVVGIDFVAPSIDVVANEAGGKHRPN